MRFLKIALAATVFCGAVHADSGLVTVRPTALYDSHSERARPLWILSGGHPARKLTSVTGWHKVEIHRPEITGWVRAAETRPGDWMIVIAEQAPIKTEPSALAANAVVVPRGSILEALSAVPFCADERSGESGTGESGTGGGCWHHVAHPDGETGHIRTGDVWRNF